MADNNFKLLFFYSVIFTFGFNILTVNAIKCYQCNSLMDLHCDTLKIDQTTGTINEKFLKDCQPPQHLETYKNHTLFCRKTIYYINYEDEARIIRGCGWLRDHSIHDKLNKKIGKTCISADNEGYLETICVCTDKDGCNSAPNQIILSKYLYSICLIVGVLSFLKKSYF